MNSRLYKNKIKVRKRLVVNPTEKIFRSAKDYSRKSDKQRLLRELEELGDSYEQTIGYATYD